jgi:serine carboxypeptidase-like clade 2
MLSPQVSKIYRFSTAKIVWVDSLTVQFVQSDQQQLGDNIDVCVEDETVNYLNRPDVQKALHARLVGVRRWAVCSK